LLIKTTVCFINSISFVEKGSNFHKNIMMPLNRLIIVDILPAFTKDNDINGLGRDLNCIHWCKEKPYL